jgi:hypothetical protein
MWLVWLAIIFLLILVLFPPSREGLTSKQLYDFQNIINDSKYSSDEKVNLIYNENEDAHILDGPIIDIFKDSSLINEEKINNLQSYFVNLLDKRNNSYNYKTVPNKLSSEEFFKLNNMLNTEFENDTEKILQIKSIGIKEKTFNDIIDSTISDEAKFSGDDEYTGPTFSSLINEILYGTFLTTSNSTSSKQNNSSKPNDSAKNIYKDIKKLNPFDKKKK